AFISGGGGIGIANVPESDLEPALKVGYWSNFGRTNGGHYPYWGMGVYNTTSGSWNSYHSSIRGSLILNYGNSISFASTPANTNPASIETHMTIETTTGNVGIGTPSPGKLLHLATTGAGTPTLRFGNQYNSFDIEYQRDAGGTYDRLDFNPGAAGVKFSFLNNGNLGIGTTAPSEKLEVCGNVKVIGTINASSTINASQSISCSSDVRFKKNITPMSNALNNVMKLQGVNYYWKTVEFPEKQFVNTQQIGFIAQDLEKIYPEMVITDKEGYKSVDYSRLTPVLVEAIKEQQKQIKALKDRLDVLEKNK
ncbi:MAG: tail fiber domain-containing protein, partial [Bacteroidia bacterium]